MLKVVKCGENEGIKVLVLDKLDEVCWCLNVIVDLGVMVIGLLEFLYNEVIE